MEKQELAREVRKKLREKSIKQKDFAISNYLDETDFRIQLSRNRFSIHTIEAICDLLEITSAEDLLKQYTFTKIKKRKPEIIAPSQILHEQLSQTLKMSSSQLFKNIRDLYSWLGESDLVVICSLSEPPLECTYYGWEILNKGIVQAVETGTVFVYIRPSEDYIKTIQNYFDFFNIASPEDEIEKLRSRLIQEGAREDNVRERIKLYQVDFCPFWAIGMRFGFYSIKPKDSEIRDMTLFARFPFGNSNIEREDAPDRNLLLYCSNKMRNSFREYLMNLFRKEDDFQFLLKRLEQQII